MATTSMIKVREETNLAGVLKSQLLSTGLSLTAKFFDTKTGVQRTPQTDTLTFTLNKNNSKAERIRCTVHSTDATTLITTLTIDAAGRALPAYGVGAGAATGFQHEIGDPIGLVTEHEPVAQILGWAAGTLASGSNSLRVGDGTDANIRYYANNNDANSPYIGYDAASSSWVVSNDGSSSVALPGGSGAYTAGDGLTLTASDFDIDLTDTVIFVQASSGAGDAGKVPRLAAGTGKLATGFITAAPFTTYISDSAALVGGAASNADALHTHTAIGTLSYYAHEGVSQYDAVGLMPVQVEHFAQLTTANLALGDSNVRRRHSIRLDPTATTTSLTTMQMMIAEAVNGATTLGDLTISIQTDNGAGTDASGTAITNGTANVISQVTQRTWNTTLAARTITWAAAPTITAGTIYWLVFECALTDAANYLNFGVNSSHDENYLTFTRRTYDLNTASWGTTTTNATPFFWFNTQTNLLGFALAPCDASWGGRTWTFVGFATAAIAAHASGSVYTQIATLTGIVASKIYYLSETPGATTLTPTGSSYNEGTEPTSFIYKVANGLSSTQATVRTGAKRVMIRETTTISATTARKYLLWFRADIVRVFGGGLQNSGNSEGGNSYGYDHRQAVGSAAMTVGPLNAGTGSGAASSLSTGGSSFTSFVGTASHTDAGFTYTYTETGTSTVGAVLEAEAA